MPKTTLFNYFVKSPPKNQASKSKKGATFNGSNTPNINEKTNAVNQKTPSKPPYVEGDVVWAKPDDQPWWPAVVCLDPATKKYINCEVKGDTLVHVRYFKNTLAQKWINCANIDRFSGSIQCEDGGKFHSEDQNVISAAKIAANALLVPHSKRLIVADKMVESENLENNMEWELENVDPKAPANADKSVKKEGNSKRIEGRAVKKCRRIIESDDDVSDGDEEYKPISTKTNGKVTGTISSDESDGDYSEEDEAPIETGKKRKRPSNTGSVKPKPNVTQAKSKLLSFQASSLPANPSTDTQSTYLHETLEFLFPENIKDAKGKRPGDEQYDKSTLKVSSDFLTKQTPAMYQWWKIKSNHFDVILFFKVGKFYELYHMDATVGVKELGLIYMKGNFAHSGFPEIAFGRYSAALVQKGYTVARVEQTETPEQNSQRIKGKCLAKYEKTLRREICRITSKGTQMYNMWDESSTHNHESNFLLAVTERMVEHSDGLPVQNACRQFGVCFVDTSVGTFHLGQFYDDRYCSRFCTMISHYYPCQVLYEKGKLSSELNKILHTGLASVIQTGLASGSQFWDAAKTLKTLSAEKYFVKNDEEVWPLVLKNMKSDTDALGLTASSEFELVVSALGASVYYLKKCLIDFEVISMSQFEMYECGENSAADVVQAGFPSPNQLMVLDSATLTNLEIIHNSKGTSEGSLLERLDHCKTPFGKRLLRQWVCSPPCHPDIINARLDAVDDFMANANVVESITATLTKMPDLERMLAQIHSMSKGMRNDGHPESRAVMYEEKKYSKKKIEDFMCVLAHYESVHNCLKKLQVQVRTFKSKLLSRILCLQNDGESAGAFPDMESTLLHWKKAFNHKKARETGKIIPNVGTNPEYDQAMQDIDVINDRAEAYLREQKKILSCSKINYKGTGNKRFQIEVPNDVNAKRIPHGYEISGQRKGFKSFRTDATIALVKEIEEAETRRDAAQADSMSIIFREFSKDFLMWKAAVEFLGQVDVLISMTQYSRDSDGVMCRPEIIHPGNLGHPMLDIREARHPCVTKTIYSEVFIPNDTLLGCCPDDMENQDEASKSLCLLLTGPNMGGKSTLMRQVGLLVVLAQMGCYVPAQSCKFTACDRIFTRLGAFDRIMAGESTFFVELGETSSILKHASKNSLVLLDELGRGTSTYDGTAIASAVLKDIADNVGCRTIFSTHYRTLVDDVTPESNIQLGHMACMVEDGDDAVEEVLTFLYKLASGACPKSYGFHAALLASVSEEVVKLARVKAAQLETNKKNMALFRTLFHKDIDGILSLE